MSRFLEKFTLYELVVTAVMAALGIAIKPVVVPLAHIACGPLMIPSGAMAGGLYMMWLVIGYGIVQKPGTALIISIIQALLVIFTGIIGSHGVMSLLTYILPGLAVEAVMIISHHRGCCAGCFAVAGLFSNAVGTATVNIVFFQAPGSYLILVLSLASASGVIGGVIGWGLIRAISGIEKQRDEENEVSGWVENLDELIKENDKSEVCECVECEGSQERKTWKWVIALAAALLIAAGISAFINSSDSSSEDGQIKLMVNGEVCDTFEMSEITKMNHFTKYVNLSSGSKEDAEGDFTGVLLSDLINKMGAEIEKDCIVYDGKYYSTVLLTAGDGYSSAADADEVNEVMIAYELDGDPLGFYEKGGTGPLRAIFVKDTYGNRSVMNLVKIDLR